MRPAAILAISAVVLPCGFARTEQSICGTYRDRGIEERHLHARKMAASNAPTRKISAATAIPDYGDIAILADSGGVVDRRNSFDLDQKTIQFSLLNVTADSYRFQTGAASYDSDAASNGSPLALGDDDTTAVNLPFPFPFFGATYQTIFVNSDGNVTFGAGDTNSAQRSLGSMVAGPPRIAPLFVDLDPAKNANGVRVLAEPARFTVSWANVPEYSSIGVGPAQTFQVRLFPDGRIEFAYNGISATSAVAGISPGMIKGSTTVVTFSANASGSYSGTVAETFSSADQIDTVAAAQAFYQTHDDTYDYLVFYNNEGVGSCPGAVACEVTVRNQRSGYGDVQVEVGQEYGSASRLQSVLNMGPLNEYPVNPTSPVPARGSTGDTDLTLLAHETGHLFLAFASVTDPANPGVPPMLDAAQIHWAFTFNSLASYLQGETIQDNGAGAEPRFLTTATVRGYAPLDQYLMGFRAPEEVTPSFWVNGPGATFANRLPQVGVSFDGQRRDVAVEDIIAAEGRRTPDSTVSQRRFRSAFVLIVPAGTMPSAADLNQIDTYRQQFETFYAQGTSSRASLDSSLKLSLTLSTFPAAGVFAGAAAPATLSIQHPAAAPLNIALSTQTGAVAVDPQVTIPADATSVTFQVTGVQSGVDELHALPSDPSYDLAVSRIQVLPGPDAARLALVSGDSQSVTARVTDINDLPYPGVTVQSPEGPAVSDANGQVKFAAAPEGQLLTLQVAGASAPVFVPSGVGFLFAAPVNSASGSSTLAPGEIASILGDHLPADTQVLLDGNPATILSTSSTRVDFLVPASQAVGSMNVALQSGSVTAALPARAQVASTSPGVFFDPATGYGAILNAATGANIKAEPVAVGDYLEIYATGLGSSGAPVQVSIAGQPAQLLYAGPAPGYQGLDQINVQVPIGVPSGPQPLIVTAGGIASNTVTVGIR